MNHSADDFKDWMDARGLSASDVATALGTEEQTIRKWRSQGVPDRRRPHVERYMAEWVDPAAKSVPPVTDEAIQSLAESRQNLVLHPTPAEFDAWSAAFKASKASTFTEWAIEGLNQF